MSSPLHSSLPPLKWEKKGSRGRRAQQSRPHLASGRSNSTLAAEIKKVGDGDGAKLKSVSTLKFRIRFNKSNCAAIVDGKKDETSVPQKIENQCEDKAVSSEISKVENLGDCNLRPRGKKGVVKKIQESKTETRSDLKAKPAKMQEKMKFSICLAPEEIEADFLTMTGSKPPAKPSSRPAGVQRQLDNSFPVTTIVISKSS